MPIGDVTIQALGSCGRRRCVPAAKHFGIMSAFEEGYMHAVVDASSTIRIRLRSEVCELVGTVLGHRIDAYLIVYVVTLSRRVAWYRERETYARSRTAALRVKCRAFVTSLLAVKSFHVAGGI